MRPLHAGCRDRRMVRASRCSPASITTRSSGCAPRSSPWPRATSCAFSSSGSACRRIRRSRARRPSTPSSPSSKASARPPAHGKARSCRPGSPTTGRPGSMRVAWPGHAAWIRLAPRNGRAAGSDAPAGAGAHDADHRWSPVAMRRSGARPRRRPSRRSPGARAQAVVDFMTAERRLVLRRAAAALRPVAHRSSRRRWPSWWRWAWSRPTASPACARCWCPRASASRSQAAGVAAVRHRRAWRNRAAGRWSAARRRRRSQARSGRDRACRAHAAAALRRRVLAHAGARIAVAAAVARAAARLSAAREPRRDPRRPLRRRLHRRAVRSARGDRHAARDPAPARDRRMDGRSRASIRSTSPAS